MWGMYNRGSCECQIPAKHHQFPQPPPLLPVFGSTLAGQASSTFLVICQFFQTIMRMWVLRIGSLSSDVFERRTSTGSGLFALLSRNFDQIFGQIVSIRVKALNNTNMVASRVIKREKGSLPVDVRLLAP